MNGIFTSLSGITRALLRFDVSAQNIANSQTGGFRAQRVNSADVVETPIEVREDVSLPNDGAELLPPSNVDLTTEVTNQLISANAFKANIAALKAQDEALGDVLDISD